jgi:phosphoadenosine phosphosulfate reductase
MTPIEQWPDAELARANAALEGADAEAIVRYAALALGRDLVMTSAFGVEGIALMDIASRVMPGIRVLFLDTGYHFPETLALRERARARFAVDLVDVTPELSVAEQDARYGARLHARDPDHCCLMRKVQPLDAALARIGARGWLAALRRDQGDTRRGIDALARTTRGGRPMLKVHPFARWSRADTWNYVMSRGLPYNELLDRGYASIGCAPCTRPVAAGEDERAGRWSGQGKTECGIHQEPGDPGTAVEADGR